ncbi:hypothetical protein BHM03_00061385 [Ensete ventricosum]|nr:hypothetical protein BHM03_00061385 [Ensete ventricosum]
MVATPLAGLDVCSIWHGMRRLVSHNVVLSTQHRLPRSRTTRTAQEVDGIFRWLVRFGHRSVSYSVVLPA